MFNLKTLAAAIAVSVAGSFGAQADTLDFSGLYGLHSDPVAVPGSGSIGATITHGFGGDILVDASFGSGAGGFCFFSGRSTCGVGGTLEFDSAVTNLTFEIDSIGFGDSVDVLAFNGLTLLATLTFDDDFDGSVSGFSGFGSITSLIFEDNSNFSGPGYSTFDFVAANSSVVPVPAALPLLLTALGALGIASRRRKATV